MKTIVVLSAACAVLAQAPAFADENRGWYVGGSLGMSMSSYSASDARANLGYSSVTVDNKSIAGKAFGGFRFSPHFAAEFGWAELGYTEISGNVGGFPAADELLAGGPFGAAVGRLPLAEGVALIGKLGVGLIAGIYTCKQLCPSIDYTESSVTLVPLLGVGVQFDVHRRFAVRFEYEYFGKVRFDDNGIINATYNLVTGGFLFKF